MNARLRKFIVVIACAFAFAILFFAWKSLSRSEPIYHGKPLHSWIEQYRTNGMYKGDEEAGKEARRAIIQIGTNGIPFLLDLMRTEDPDMKKWLRTVLPRKYQAKFRERLKDRSDEIQLTGVVGFEVLGARATSALPALIEIGRHHPAEYGRYLAVGRLRELGPPAESAVPFLLECLTNNSLPSYRGDVVEALGHIHRRPEIAVPAMIKYLETATRGYEVGAIYMIAFFETNAKPAVPLLLSMLNHTNHQTREAVTNCLPRIDKEAATRAHLKPRK